jgi:hypothetical protein
LVAKVRSVLEVGPENQRLLGTVRQAEGRFWVDINYPAGPPPHYEYSGCVVDRGVCSQGTEVANTCSIQIGDEIRWTTKELSQQDFVKLKRTFIPIGTMLSVWESTKFIVTVQMQRVKELLWTDAPSFPGAQPGAPRALHVLNPFDIQQAAKSEGSTSQPGRQAVTKIGLPQVSAKTSEEIHSQTVATFLRTFRKGMRQQLIITNGSIVMSGLIEAVGARGRATLDVRASYDLKTEQFVSISLVVRSFQQAKQRARG